MYMVRLIYVSHLSKECSHESIGEIMTVADEHNAESNITGMLCYDSRFFLQCLEGPRNAVNAVYRDIINDNRNTNVVLIEYTDIHCRDFCHWSMAFVRADSIDTAILLRYNAGSVFDPYLMSAQQALGFLKELRG